MACAEEGVRLLPADAPVPPPPQTIEVTRIYYRVGGLLFDTKEAAEHVATVASGYRRFVLTYIGGSDYRRQYAVHDDGPVEATDAKEIDKHLYETHRMRLDQHAAETVSYQESRREYDAICAKRAEVNHRIRAVREAARQLERRKQSIMAEFERYLDLADLNVLVARKFLVKAYDDAETICPDLFRDGLVITPARAIRVRGVQREEVTA